jgi:hypothetical protein
MKTDNGYKLNLNGESVFNKEKTNDRINQLDIIDHHILIRETVGYDMLKEVDVFDMPKIIEFLKIMYNYNRMKRVLDLRKK